MFLLIAVLAEQVTWACKGDADRQKQRERSRRFWRCFENFFRFFEVSVTKSWQRAPHASHVQRNGLMKTKDLVAIEKI